MLVVGQLDNTNRNESIFRRKGFSTSVGPDPNPGMVKGTISSGRVRSKLSDCNRISGVSVEESRS